jgi:mercuric ion binding protein
MTFYRTLAVAALTVAAAAAAPLASAKQQTVALNVPTMDCATCPITIKAALSKVPGVAKVKVSYEKREAVIVYDDAQASVADLKKATEDVGYPAMLKTAK